jgi:hypothetical protein
MKTLINWHWLRKGHGVSSDATVGIPFVVSKEVIRSHLKQEHLNRWKTCKVGGQSKTLMSEPVLSRTGQLQAMSTQKNG